MQARAWRERVVLAGAMALALSCAPPAEDEEAAAAPPEAAPPASAARAVIEPKSGSQVSGVATFQVNADGTVSLELHLHGLPPGVHAVHIHEFGDCSAEDAASAGGHWNPTGAPHGRWGAEAFHLGDIGNVEADAEGHASLTLTTDLWSIGTGEANDIADRALVVHEKADDFTSQPTGAAGGRIGCGVIEAGGA